jgi:hypothetical protein
MNYAHASYLASLRLVAAMVVATTTSSAQSSWTLATNLGPSPRSNHAMAFDSFRGRALCFGGSYLQNNGNYYLGDTWEWDGANWAPQIFANGPSARAGARMVFDSIRGRLLLLGGTSLSPTGSYVQHDDMWSWSGVTWQLVTNTVPSSGQDACAAFDSLRDRLFWLPSGATHPYEWDGSVWQHMVTVGGPGPRYSTAVAFDAARARIVLYGGRGVSGPLDDTWEWSGTSWTYKGQLGGGQSGRQQHAMYYDSIRQRVVMIGGQIVVPTGPYTTGLQPNNLEWEWDGNQWIYGGAAPLGIAGAEASFDTGQNVAWVFGGFDVNGNSIGSTWQRAGAGSGSPYGNGCGAPALALSQVLSSQPRLNSTAVARVTNLPSPVGVMAVGFSKQFYGPFLLPLVLNGLGMPGCQLLHSADVFGESLAFLSSTTANYSLAIPNTQSLVGAHVYLQAFAVAPGMNAREIIASNGLDWNIGL